MNKRLLVAAMLGLTFGLVGCGEKPKTGTIVTTIGMVTDIVRNVVGDLHPVEGLMDASHDPHLYKPTRDDVLLIQSASVVFYNGLMLEGRMTDTFSRAQNKGVLAYPVAQGIEEKFLLEPEGFAGHWDPHVWMDVTAWRRAVPVVADAMASFDPVNADTFKKNAVAYAAKLDGLDAYAMKVIRSIPENQRLLITAHDAFNYFGRRYKIQVEAVQGLSTESQAGIDDINRLVDLIIKRKVPAVFFESTVDKKNVQKLIEGAADKGHTVIIGGELFSDAMGKEGTYEGTYIGMIDHNVTTIARALGGEAPEKVLNGKLHVHSAKK
jgi:manganese/zinc/iron transport system substrate-binding protein